MSESNPITSVPGGYTLGSPISTHQGVSCYPAIGSDEKRYILKAINVPASQTQLDALILTGAYPDPTAALDYFRQQAESISGEAELLQRLSKLDGFLAYDECRVAPLEENRLGYQVTLISPFRRSMERFIRMSPVTHLDMVNLGLDMCAALACARRAGYLYVDLKPSNIFISDDREYKIGDLGFAALDGLNYTSMPEKYVSPYTAPEMREPMEVINETADTYAVGMILYRLLNNGKLPAKNRDWSTPLPAPVNADQEIWEIVMKACDPDPAKRWESPTAMGQALVAYMQRNSINAVPLTEPVVNRQTGKIPKLTGVLPKAAAEQAAPVTDETRVFTAVTEDKAAEAEQTSPAEPKAEEQAAAPEQEASVRDASTEKKESSESSEEAQAAPEDKPAEEAAPAEAPVEAEKPDTEVKPEDAEVPAEAEKAEEALKPVETAKAEETAKPVETAKAEESTKPAETPKPEAAAKPAEKEPAPKAGKPAAAVKPAQISEPAKKDVFPAEKDPVLEDIAQFLANYDDLTPGAAQSAPAEAPKNTPETPAPVQEAPAPQAPAKAPADKPAPLPKLTKVYDPGHGKDVAEEEKPVRKHYGRAIFTTLLVLVLLGSIAFGGLWYYRTMYVQKVDGLSVEGTRDGLSVTVSAGFDTSRLTVSCVDPYGNAQNLPLENGTAVFKDLRAGTLYNIYLETTGNHKLEGETYAVFTTEHEANVVSLSAITGAEDGSLIVSLNVDGREPDKWLIVCSAEGEEDTSVSFSGHSVTIRGLAVGKDYVLKLGAEDGAAVSGQTELEISVSGLILAQNLNITSTDDRKLDITWDPPTHPVASWEVRCYCDNYDETQTVVDTHAVFEGIDPNRSYTVEVTAEGMTQSARANISANPIKITEFKLTPGNNKLTLSWTHIGATPLGGWLVMYTVDGSPTPNVVKTEKTSADIKLVIPNSTYEFTVQAADGTSIFDNVYSEKTPEAKLYKDHSINPNKVTIRTLVTPSKEGWLADDLDKDSYTKNFKKGENISLVLDSTGNFYLQPGDVTIRYIFRDGNGSVLLNLVSDVTVDWKELWFDRNYHLAELDLRSVPTAPGDYTLDLLFDGQTFGSTQFSISE